MMHFTVEEIHKAGDAWQAFSHVAGRFGSAG